MPGSPVTSHSNWTLKLADVASLPVALYAGRKIAPISFTLIANFADEPSDTGVDGSRCQGERGSTSRPLS